MAWDRWILVIAVLLTGYVGHLAFDVAEHAKEEITIIRKDAQQEIAETGDRLTETAGIVGEDIKRFSRGMVRWSEGQTKATKYAIALDTGQAIIVAAVILIFILLPAVGVRVFTRRQYERKGVGHREV